VTCCGDGFEAYTGRHVATSALGGIGQLVLYHLSRLTLARDSHGLGIRLLGGVIHERRKKYGVLRRAWVFLPNPATPLLLGARWQELFSCRGMKEAD